MSEIVQLNTWTLTEWLDRFPERVRSFVYYRMRQRIVCNWIRKDGEKLSDVIKEREAEDSSEQCSNHIHRLKFIFQGLGYEYAVWKGKEWWEFVVFPPMSIGSTEPEPLTSDIKYATRDCAQLGALTKIAIHINDGLPVSTAPTERD